MIDKVKILDAYLKDEFSTKEAQLDILYFMLNSNIRMGEYEGNRCILKKLDAFTFIVYTEDIYPSDMHREISDCAVFTKEELLTAMAKMLGTSEQELVAMSNIFGE